MEHVYVAERASGFNFTVIMEDKKGKDTRVRVRFDKGQFKTDDDKLAAAIDEQLEDNPAIRRQCRKADEAAALKLAIAHKKMMDRTGAHKGGVHSDAAKRSMAETLHDRDEELQKANVDSQAFADDSLQLTEEIEPIVPPEVEKPKGIILGGGQ